MFLDLYFKNNLRIKSKFGSESPIKKRSNTLLKGIGLEVATGPPPTISGNIFFFE